MADPRAFVSFDFDHDEELKRLFVGQPKNPRTPFSMQDWSSKSSLPQAQWEAIVEGRISRCHMVIALVGKHMATASGVDKELAMATRNDVPFFGVYVDGANTVSNLPKGLPRSRTVAWAWDKIADMVDQMLTEGKNAR